MRRIMRNSFFKSGSFLDIVSDIGKRNSLATRIWFFSTLSQVVEFHTTVVPFCWSTIGTQKSVLNNTMDFSVCRAKRFRPRWETRSLRFRIFFLSGIILIIAITIINFSFDNIMYQCVHSVHLNLRKKSSYQLKFDRFEKCKFRLSNVNFNKIS